MGEGDGGEGLGTGLNLIFGVLPAWAVFLAIQMVSYYSGGIVPGNPESQYSISHGWARGEGGRAS